jgi:predicted transcriptional regulator
MGSANSTARSAERLFCYNPKGCLKMAATKSVNYTPEMTAEIVSAYMVGDTVETIAERAGKSVRSIVAKLSREGVYKKAEYVTKSGERAEKKDVTADAIGAILNLSENDTASLAKANKSALKAVFAALANSKPL